MGKSTNTNYYIDIDRIDEIVTIKTTKKDSEISEQQISVAKYEIVMLLLDVILSEEENTEYNENLGITLPNQSSSYKIAFNSLINQDIIKKL